MVWDSDQDASEEKPSEEKESPRTLKRFPVTRSNATICNGKCTIGFTFALVYAS